ncbi:MAG: diphthine--ammonia ligase, partial [Candidatus Micrarchaeia archaeon]
TERDNYLFFHMLHSIVGNVTQPLNGKGTLVANCEIYNWKELANKHGITCRNDAELLFRLLEDTDILNPENVLNLLDSLDGDFACVYYRDGVFVLFRDIFGVNPLFYSTDPFIICSERKAAPFTRELHPRQIIFYDTNGRKKTVIHNTFDRLLSNKKNPSYESVKSSLLDAIDKRITESNFGILFSCGIDSLLIALRMQELGKNPVLYTTYVSDSSSEDIKYVEKFVDEYSFTHKLVEVSNDEIDASVSKVCDIIESTDPIKVSIALPLFFACNSAGKGGHNKVIYSGLGADDIFCGYARFRDSTNIHNEQLSSVRALYERDLYRDNTIAMSQRLELRVPFLDKSLFLHAYYLDEKELYGKHILRRILKEHYRLDKMFYDRPKRAVQYGSGFMEVLRKLSKPYNKQVGKYIFSKHPKKYLRLAALYTGGKDSAYAIYLMKSMNYDIVSLVSMIPSNKYSYMYHSPDVNIIENHSVRMGIPLIVFNSSGVKEEEVVDLENALQETIDKYNIEGVITGAICSDYQRTRIERVCEKIGIRMFSPLWHVDQETYLRNLVNTGFVFKIVSVSADGLDDSWVGKKISKDNIDGFIDKCKAHKINIAGEGGEYETEVVSSPLFDM